MHAVDVRVTEHMRCENFNKCRRTVQCYIDSLNVYRPSCLCIIYSYLYFCVFVGIVSIGIAPVYIRTMFVINKALKKLGIIYF